MDFNLVYKELAAQLGDVTYKLKALETEQRKLIETIARLDAAAAQASKEQNGKAQTQKPASESGV
jgi:hypothetical protein